VVLQGQTVLEAQMFLAIPFPPFLLENLLVLEALQVLKALIHRVHPADQ